MSKIATNYSKQDNERRMKPPSSAVNKLINQFITSNEKATQSKRARNFDVTGFDRDPKEQTEWAARTAKR